MTEFTITKTHIDDDGVEQQEVETYSSTFEDGVFSVSSLDPETEEFVSCLSQPWNPKGDGTRVAWESEEQAIEWFKSTKE